METEVFNRYENKYMIEEQTFYTLKNEILKHMDLDEHNKNGKKYNIYNIYYDTDDNYFMQTSIQKPKYKEKVRIRSYDISKSSDDLIYIEVKKKLNGLVNKRRTKMELADAYEFLKTGEIPKLQDYMNKQVINEISYILQRQKLVPKVYISYERIAYVGKKDRNLRISFDANVLTRIKQLKLELGDFGEELLEDYQLLMEIKSRNAIPIWLTKLIAQYEIYPASFSKCGVEYKKRLRNNKKILIKIPNIEEEGGDRNVAVNF